MPPRPSKKLNTSTNPRAEFWIPPSMEMARASKRLIISAEEIVPHEEIAKYPERTLIPYYIVDAVVHAPGGALPGEMPYDYWRDEEHMKLYFEQAKDADG